MKQYLPTIYCRPKNDAKIIINYPNVGALTSVMLEIHWSGDRQTNKELIRCNMTHVCCEANI